MATTRKNNVNSTTLSRLKYLVLFIIFFISLLPNDAQAHGDLHVRIVKLTQLIKENPDSIELYLKRGELYFYHNDFDSALADYLVVKQKKPDFPKTDFLLGQLFNKFDYPKAGLLHIHDFIASQGDIPNAYIIRAEIQTKLGLDSSAVIDYIKAISLMDQPKPDVYLDLSKAYLKAYPQDIKGAIACLNKGIKDLGEVLTLQSKIIELLIQNKQYDLAIEKIDSIIAKMIRSERWLMKKGEVLLKAGKLTEAKAVFAATKEEIEKLPDGIKKTQAIQTMQKEVDTQLSYIKNHL